MKNAAFLSSPLVALLLAVAPHVRAADWYVSPTGTATTGCTTRATPCDLASAASGALAGDTVYLMDGVYKTGLDVVNSGTADAWITFKADQCATPIIEGPGSAPTDEEDQSSGVHSEMGSYLRFEGIISRGWNQGFSNRWVGSPEETEEVSNGNWEIRHCLSYSNGRTGFTFFSGPEYKLINSISAHNGTSQKHSWSSGVTFYHTSGTGNLVQGVISFENTDEDIPDESEKSYHPYPNTDGSGFIVDEGAHGVTFLNNLAFGNSGSCLRMTKSSRTTFINNTCYLNARFGSRAQYPDNPGELYFTGLHMGASGTVVDDGINFKNNVIVGGGMNQADRQPLPFTPTTGWTNNVVVTGAVTFFTAPSGVNPDFTPATGATQLVGKGTSGNGAPTADLGFDPKCIVKRAPVMVGEIAKLDTWQFDIDIEYIKSIGGVDKCWNPAMRAEPLDIGAYKAGAITTATPGACVSPPIPDPVPVGGAGGAGGAPPVGTGGAAPVATGGSTVGVGGGAPGAAGAPSPVATGGAPGAGGGAGSTATPVPGAGAPATGTPAGVAGASSSAGAGATPGGTPPTANGQDGCGCRTASKPGLPFAAFAMLALSLFGLKRRGSRAN